MAILRYVFAALKPGVDREEYERYEREDRQRRTARLVLEHTCGSARRERVGNAAGQQDDERRSDDPCQSPHPTTSVNGAVSTRPSTLHWRKSRHVPGTGTSTPTRS